MTCYYGSLMPLLASHVFIYVTMLNVVAVSEVLAPVLKERTYIYYFKKPVHRFVTVWLNTAFPSENDWKVSAATPPIPYGIISCTMENILWLVLCFLVDRLPLVCSIYYQQSCCTRFWGKIFTL